jgi:hypothetical protein
MSGNDLVGAIQISEQLIGGEEPQEMVTLRVDAAGFHDAGGIGRSGQEVGVLDAAQVARMLSEHFDPADLRTLLGHFVEVHDALASG